MIPADNTEASGTDFLVNMIVNVRNQTDGACDSKQPPSSGIAADVLFGVAPVRVARHRATGEYALPMWRYCCYCSL